MSIVRLISDLHLGHVNLANNIRGFSDIDEHNRFVIKQFNSVVTSKHDLTFVLGDLTMEKKTLFHLLDELNGRIVVVGGNHDDYKHCHALLEHVEAIGGCIEYKGFVLTHIPIHESQIDRFRGNIHGHMHTFTIDHPKYFNVSCEVVDFKPKTIDELIEINKIKYNLK